MRKHEAIIGAFASGVAAELARGMVTYIHDTTMQDPNSYAVGDAVHTMLPWTQAPSIAEAFAQQSATTTPDVATAQPIAESLTSFVHTAISLAPHAFLLALIGGGLIFAGKMALDMRRAANDIDTSTRRRQLD